MIRFSTVFLYLCLPKNMLLDSRLFNKAILNNSQIAAPGPVDQDNTVDLRPLHTNNSASVQNRLNSAVKGTNLVGKYSDDKIAVNEIPIAGVLSQDSVRLQDNNVIKPEAGYDDKDRRRMVDENKYEDVNGAEEAENTVHKEQKHIGVTKSPDLPQPAVTARPDPYLNIPDPCLQVGLTLPARDLNDLDLDPGVRNVTFNGTGDYHACKRSMLPLLNQSVPCSSEPCSMNGVHQPTVSYHNTQFYGFSEFWYTMEDVFRIGGQYEFGIFDTHAKVTYTCTLVISTGSDFWFEGSTLCIACAFTAC